MPFAKSCRITLTNEGRRRARPRLLPRGLVEGARASAGHALLPRALQAGASGAGGEEALHVPRREGPRFLRRARSSRVIQPEAGWFGEGDERIYVDGEKEPSIIGTGSEDYFNDAWGLHVVDGPYTGVTVADGTGLGSRMTGYRWHIKDPIPFKKSFRFDIEHLGWTFNNDGSLKSAYGTRDDLHVLGRVLVPGRCRDGPLAGAVRLGAAAAGQRAASSRSRRRSDRSKTEKGKAQVFTDLFWSKDVLIFKAEGPGSKLEIPFEVAEAGDYELYTQVAQGSDYGIYTVLLDGKPPVAPVLEHEPGADVRPQLSFDGYAYETYVGMDYQVGWPRLTKGRHTLTYVCLGKNAASTGYVLGVDNIVLAQVGAAGWAKAAAVKAAPGADGPGRCDEGALGSGSGRAGARGARAPRKMGAAAAPATSTPSPRG